MNDSIGKAFIKQTMHSNLQHDQSEKKLPPQLEMPYQGVAIKLPKPTSFKGLKVTVKNAINNRKSIREYADEPLSKLELSFALYSMQGVHKTVKNTTFRTVPSAGARHAFETLVLVNNVKSLTSGLYHYIAIEHQLVKINTQNDISSQLTKACLNQKMVKNAAVTFFFIADIYRMTYRYGERGYRYIFLDAGHIVQNLYLVAQEMDAGTVAIGAFDDAAVNALFNLDGEAQFVVYAAPLGKRLKD